MCRRPASFSIVCCFALERSLRSCSGTTECSESGHSPHGMRRRVRAERARANDMEAEQRTVHTKLTVPDPDMD